MKVVLILLALPAVFAESVRIVTPANAKEGVGRVEVQHEGEWGTVCDEGWDKKDAQVVCQENGFIKAIHETRRAKYGQGSGKVWLKNVNCKGSEMSLTTCPHGEWGQVGECNHGRDAGVKCLHDAVPQILEVGCYADIVSERALDHLYENNRKHIDWYNLRSMVTRCAEGAHARGYKYFGIQFFGECHGSANGSLTFDKHWEAHQCIEGIKYPDASRTMYKRVGLQSHNYVYRFAPWKDLGCWQDDRSDRSMKMLDNFRMTIDWFNPIKTVEKCYEVAKKAGYKYFAVQFYGECWVSNSESYKKHGQSIKCWSGCGMNWTNYVYKVLW